MQIINNKTTPTTEPIITDAKFPSELMVYASKPFETVLLTVVVVVDDIGGIVVIVVMGVGIGLGSGIGGKLTANEANRFAQTIVLFLKSHLEQKKKSQTRTNLLEFY